MKINLDKLFSIRIIVISTRFEKKYIGSFFSVFLLLKTIRVKCRQTKNLQGESQYDFSEVLIQFNSVKVNLLLVFFFFKVNIHKFKKKC